MADAAVNARRALVIGISEYDNHSAVPGAQADAVGAVPLLMQLGFQLDVLHGNVPMRTLRQGVTGFVGVVSEDAKTCSEPLALVLVSSHALQTEAADMVFPNLLASDAPTEVDAELDTFDTGMGLVAPLNQVVARDGGEVRVVMIFDCCRVNVESMMWRAPSILPRLRNDFYIAFSCDPGRRARESATGGKLLKEVLQLLPFARPITEILEEAARRALQSGAVVQRPWVHYRVGLSAPVLGFKQGNFPRVGGAPRGPANPAARPPQAVGPAGMTGPAALDGILGIVREPEPELLPAQEEERRHGTRSFSFVSFRGNYVMVTGVLSNWDQLKRESRERRTSGGVETQIRGVTGVRYYKTQGAGPELFAVAGDQVFYHDADRWHRYASATLLPVCGF